MKTYIAHVYKDPDSAFGVAFPDLPGCYGAGDTYEEALEAAKISLREYAIALADDGMDMPKPSTHAALMADATASIEFDKAAFIADVPLITVGSRKRVNVSMDDRLLSALDHAALIAGVNRSVLLAEAAKDWMRANVGAVFADKKTLQKKRGKKKNAELASA